MLVSKKLAILKRKMIKTEFHYTAEEIKDFFRFQLLTKEKTKWIYYLSLVFFVLIGALLVFIFKQKVLGFLIIILSVILMLIFPLQVNRTLNKQVHSRYKRAKQLITFGKDITQKIDDKLITYQWNKILEVNETHKYLYLYISKNAAIIINKTMITDNDYQALITLIKEHNLVITLYKHK